MSTSRQHPPNPCTGDPGPNGGLLSSPRAHGTLGTLAIDFMPDPHRGGRNE